VIDDHYSGVTELTTVRYFLYYHQQFPVIDSEIDPISTFHTSPVLFWSIVFTASRNLPSRNNLTNELCKSLPNLVSKLMVQRDDSLQTIQALLVLSMWPFPVRRQSDDLRWIYSGVAMQMAIQTGLHRVGYEHEYRPLTFRRSQTDSKKHTRIWRCWCFVNAV
jgi:hypothetical protein